jgi:chlorobactene glucosyltransferase
MKLFTLIILGLWAISFANTLVNIALVPRLRAGVRATRQPLVSVIIPARDEERVIGRTIRAMLAQTYAHIEIIVVNDRSTDATGEILRDIRDERLLVIDGDEPPAGWLGKTWALHQGSLRADGELLLFVDADVIYAPGAIDAAVARQERTGSDLTALLPHFEMHGVGENAAMPMLPMFCYTFIPTWAINRTRSPALGLGGGTGNLVTRDPYVRGGGHEALKDAVVDDVALARLIRRAGGRTEAVAAFDLVSLRMYRGLAEIVDGFTKNSFTTFGRSYVISALTIAGTLLFHIMPYGFAVRGDVVSIAIVALITATRVILFRYLRYPLWSALLLHPVMAAIWGWIFVRSLWLTGVRRQVLWRGRTYDARQTQFGAGRR